jgi:hypothetical protein
MHPIATSDHVFPLSQGSSERPSLRPPRLAFGGLRFASAPALELAPGREWAALKPIPTEPPPARSTFR